MSVPTETQPGAVRSALDAIRSEHEELYNKVCTRRADLAADAKNRPPIVREVESLLAKMGKMASQAWDTEQFDWLSEASVQWQSVFTEVFNIPKDVRADVGVVSPSEGLIPATPPMSQEQIEAYFYRMASRISESRKLTALARQLEFLQHDRDSIHRTVRSSHEEMEQDWYAAHVYLAGEILAGRVDFTRAFQKTTFSHLEQVWLDDVKQLEAYRGWEGAGDGWQPCPERFYLDACHRFRDLAFNGSIKASPATFLAVGDYVRSCYFGRDGDQAASVDTAHRLIAQKAHRLWQLRGHASDSKTNWSDAEQYVVGYYKNIGPAVLAEAAEAAGAVTAVVKAISDLPAVVNAFEAAIVVYYVSADLLQTACTDLGRSI